MIPLLPSNSHLDFARELDQFNSRKPGRREWPDGADLVTTRPIPEHDQRPDPLYIAMNRFWTRTIDLLFGGFRKTA
jgi:hypothetical protein